MERQKLIIGSMFSWPGTLNSGGLLALGTALCALCACGGPDKQTPLTAQASSSSAAPAVQNIALPQTQINLDAALGRLPIEMIETAPCPFLSDVTAINGVATNFEFARRRVANDECIWNYNIGFEINVRIKPRHDALPRAQRVYNLDVPPVLDPQSGPGTDAVVFLDPTWDASTPRPYAFGFTLDGQDIMISTVGVKTSPSQLRAVADEIALKLPSAPMIEPQHRQTASSYDPCQIWSVDEVGAVFGVPEGEASHSSPFGQTACTYGFNPQDGPSIQVRAGLTKCSDDSIESLKARGFDVVTGFDVPTVSKTETHDWGTDIYFESQRSGYCISVASMQNREPVPSGLKPGLETLVRNLIARSPTE